MIIYALIDPRDGRVRYIGKTVRTAHRRLRRHLARCYLYETSTHKNRWLRQLLALGLEPRIEILEEHQSAAELCASEQRCIAAYLAAGEALTNTTPGGDGRGTKHTEASKEKIRQALKGKPKTLQHRSRVSAAQKGRVTSEETRGKLSLAQKARRRDAWSEEHRIAISRGMGGRPFIDQYGNTYETQNSAARQLGLNLGHLNEVLHGTRKSTGGYVFTYLRVQQFPAIPLA